MDLESIIWIVIFLVYIASIILKKTRRAAKTKQEPVATGLGPDQTASPAADIEDSERPAEKRRPGWQQRLTGLQGQLRGRLGDFMNQIQQELEAAKEKDQKDKGKETGWEKLLPAKDHKADLVAKKKAATVDVTATDLKAIKADSKKDAATRTAAARPRKIAAPTRLQTVRPAPSIKPKPSVQKMIAVRQEPADVTTDITASGLTFTVRDLRRAVIWTEILSPPVALRDDYK